MLFRDRSEAGRRLAERLGYLRRANPVVVGLPRGGVPVAFEVAQALDAPLDVIVVRKLGVPFQPEVGMGAIGEDGVRIVNTDVIRRARVSEQALAAVEACERAELDRRARRFRGGRARVPLAGRTVIIVDDGIATGSTARAACQVAREHGAACLVLAVPVAPCDWSDRLQREADELVSLATPEPFIAVGRFYADFSPTSDDEVVACLERAAGHPTKEPFAAGVRLDHPAARDEAVEVGVGRLRLAGQLTVPEGAVRSGARGNRYGADIHIPGSPGPWSPSRDNTRAGPSAMVRAVARPVPGKMLISELWSRPSSSSHGSNGPR